MNLDIGELAREVHDAAWFELPLHTKIVLPEIFGRQISRFMVVEAIAGLLMLAIFIPLARKVQNGRPPRGWLWNMFEVMVLFIRDQVVRPAIGGREADRFLPFILTMFFFILFCNLLGMAPWLGAPTASISVTGALAALAFVTMLWAGIKKFGPVRFWTGLCPHMDMPWIMALFLVPMILFIEVFGLVIKHTILAVRLLANIFAGHLVLAVIVGFIGIYAQSVLWYGIMPASVLGAAALGLLELLVAFLQAYIFAFLAALFIGMAVHQH
jgi:F-type H+-transporting ATPase subunit a